MEFTIENEGADFGTLVVTPGPDDQFEVSGYATRGQVHVRLPLYSHEAKQLAELLSPLAVKEET